MSDATESKALRQLVAQVCEIARAQGVCVVGIDGCARSGKSRLLKELVVGIEPEGVASLGVTLDWYWQRRTRRVFSVLPAWDIANFDYQWRGLRADVLRPLQVVKQTGQAGQILVRRAVQRVVPPAVVVVEGVTALRRELRAFYDVRVFVEVSEARRRERAFALSGRLAPEYFEQYWWPMENYYLRTHQPQRAAQFCLESG